MTWAVWGAARKIRTGAATARGGAGLPERQSREYHLLLPGVEDTPNWEGSDVCPSLAKRIPEHGNHNFLHSSVGDICDSYVSVPPKSEDVGAAAKRLQVVPMSEVFLVSSSCP